MKKLFLHMLLIAGLSSAAFAQKTIDKNDICEPEKNQSGYSPIPVTSFKDSLTIKLKITKAFDTKKNYDDEIVFTETFKNETSIIQIAPTIALQVLVTRVEIAGKKYYLSAITYYTKKGKCWILLSDSPSWSKLSLDSYTSGNSYNGVGFDGELSIK